MTSREGTSASILVQIQDSFLLLDAGSGCLGQMYVRYGTMNTEHILRHLKGIWISHEHIDHIAGLISLLAKRRELTDRPVAIGCPASVAEMLAQHEQEYYEEGYFGITMFDRDQDIKLEIATIRSFPV